MQKFLALISVVALSACTTATQIEPAPAAATIDGQAVEVVDGVRIVAEAGEWPGNVNIEEEVTPMRVTITNNSNRPIAIRYGEFALVSADGERYNAIPPFRVEGTVVEPRLAPGFAPVTTPGFVYDRFFVAPYLSPLYPGVTAFTDPFLFDPFYYDQWREVRLPTAEMVRRALPEGVVQPGGSVSGFLYFEEVDDDDEMLQFRANLMNARTSQRFGVITIPFTVEET